MGVSAYGNSLALSDFTSHHALTVHPCCRSVGGFLLLIWLSDPRFHRTALSLHQHLGCFRVLAPANNAAGTWGCRCLFKLVFLFPWDIVLEVKLMDLMVVLFVIFWDVPILFAVLVPPTFGPTDCHEELLSSSLSPASLSPCFFFFFFFLPAPVACEASGPGIEPAPQQWQCQTLNPLTTRELLPRLSDDGHSNRREVTPHCGFNLHFLNN